MPVAWGSPGSHCPVILIPPEMAKIPAAAPLVVRVSTRAFLCYFRRPREALFRAGDFGAGVGFAAINSYSDT
jgi:hypothetical protein